MFSRIKQDYIEKGFAKIEGYFSEAEIEQLLFAVSRIEQLSQPLNDDDDVFQFEKRNNKTTTLLRRIENPHRHFEVINAFARSKKVIDLLTPLLGENIRLHNSKINIKPPSGAPVQWHQDWAFYPHTNDSFLTFGVILDEASEQNGAIACLPGSHTGKIYDHRNPETGRFCHAISRKHWDEKLDPLKGELLVGPKGTVTIHHVRTLHGSGPNHSNTCRRFLLIGYAAADAWPLLGVSDFREYEDLMVAGSSTVFPRMAQIPITVPYPLSDFGDRFFESQRALTQTYY